MQPVLRSAARLLLVLALLTAAAAWAGDGRLLTTDAAEPIPTTVIGLQRTAVALPWGFAVDSSLIADVALAPNVGLRFAFPASWGTFVVGARYTQFVGSSVYSSVVQSNQPAITSFSPDFRGPSVYLVFGHQTGPWLYQMDVRFAFYASQTGSVTAALGYGFAEHWQVVAEGGVRIGTGPLPKGALGIRYSGDHFGATLGAAYAGLTDPFLNGAVPVLPVLDLSWSF